MNINILGPLKPVKNPTNKYKLVVDFMHGDADGDTDETLLFDKDDVSSLSSVIEGYNFLEKARDQRDVRTSHISKHLVSIGLKEEVAEEISDLIADNRPGDHTADYSFPASYEGYTLTFFNENGIEHNCEVK